MSVYTVGRLIEEFRTIAGEAGADFWGATAKQIIEESLTDFFSVDWPWATGEDVVATLAPYATGTVAVVNGVRTVTLTGGAWNTGWTTPAVIRIEGSSGDALLVESFNSATQLTLDLASGWPFDSDVAATYSIEFPAHAIPSYVQVIGVTEARLSNLIDLRKSSMVQMLANRPWVPSSFWPGEYDVVPSDGVTGQKLFVYPAPAQVQTLRYRYQRAVPAFRCYRVGVATANNAGNVTGTGTNWSFQGLGYSAIGDYFEFIAQPGHQVEISAVPSGTALTLVAGGYTGVSAADSPYWISPRILCPDDLKPLIRATVRWKYFEDAQPQKAQLAYARYSKLRDQAISRYVVTRDVSPVRPIDAVPYDYGAPPAMPSVLKVE